MRELRYDKRSGSRPLRLADGHLRLTAVNHLREHVRRRQTGSPQVKAVAGHLGTMLHTLQGVEVPLPGLASLFQRHGRSVFEYSDLSQEVKWLVAGRASCALSVSLSVCWWLRFITLDTSWMERHTVTDNGTADKSPRTSAVCGDELNNGHDGVGDSPTVVLYTNTRVTVFHRHSQRHDIYLRAVPSIRDTSTYAQTPRIL